VIFFCFLLSPFCAQDEARRNAPARGPRYPALPRVASHQAAAQRFEAMPSRDRLAQNASQAAAVVEELETLAGGGAMDAAVLNAVLSVATKGLNFDAAFRLVEDEFPARGLRPTHHTYRRLVRNRKISRDIRRKNSLGEPGREGEEEEGPATLQGR